MNSIPIPCVVFDSPMFHALSSADQIFLMFLYAMFYDTERFTIDMNDPKRYHLPHDKASISRRITHLIKAGFLVVVGYQKISICNKVRVFSLTHISE
jgi:hypothetical protein